VTAYYANNTVTSGFPTALEQAIHSTTLGANVAILNATITASTNATPVAEGAGSTLPSAGGNTAVAGLQGNMAVANQGLTPGGAVGIAFAGVVLLIGIGFIARRGNNRTYERDDTLLKLINTQDEDDDETLFRPTEITSKNRVAHILGEDESFMTGEGSNVEVKPLYADNRLGENNCSLRDGDHHFCASPNCEQCERKRQQGVVFVHTTSCLTEDSGVPSQRSYQTHDTVDL
jgi:hypothetical protein